MKRKWRTCFIYHQRMEKYYSNIFSNDCIQKKWKKHLCRKKMPLKFGKIEWKVPWRDCVFNVFLDFKSVIVLKMSLAANIFLADFWSFESSWSWKLKVDVSLGEWKYQFLYHLVIEQLPQDLRDRCTEMRELDLKVQSKNLCLIRDRLQILLLILGKCKQIS